MVTRRGRNREKWVLATNLCVGCYTYRLNIEYDVIDNSVLRTEILQKNRFRYSYSPNKNVIHRLICLK